MSAPRATFDGLWRCLCPAIDAAALTKALAAPRPRPSKNLRTPRSSQICHARLSHSTATANRPVKLSESHGVSRDGQGGLARNAPRMNERVRGMSNHKTQLPGTQPRTTSNEDDPFFLVFQRQSPPKEQINTTDPQPQKHDSAPYGPIDDTIDKDMLRGINYRELLHRAPTPVIYEALKDFKEQQVWAYKVREFVSHLVEARGEPMSSTLIEALVIANWDTAGSGADLWKIARDKNVVKTSEFYEAILQALAIHPSYYLRNFMLKEMNLKWLELSAKGQYNVALGLLRDKQYELAWEKLEAMVEHEVFFPGWVFDIFITTFTRLGFLDEALEILQMQRRLVKQARAASLNVMYYMLDEGSRALHHGATSYIWREMVDTNILNPSDGITSNALNTFSRHGDVELATKAIQLLSSRSVKLGIHHYEALIDCYAINEDLDNALRVLCIMDAAGLRMDRSSTRSIYTLMMRLDQNDRAVKAVYALGNDHEIPIEAFNVVIEALSMSGDMDRAIHLYQRIGHLRQAGPDLETFELLLGRLPRGKIVDFLLAEMASFSLEPTQGMRDLVVRSYALDASSALDDAFRVLKAIEDKAKESDTDSWISRATVLSLIERCFKDEDARVWSIINRARLYVPDIEDEVRTLLAKWDLALGLQQA